MERTPLYYVYDDRHKRRTLAAWIRRNWALGIWLVLAFNCVWGILWVNHNNALEQVVCK